MNRFTESTVEEAALAWLEAIGWQIAHGQEIAPLPDRQAGDMPAAERGDYREVVPAQRLHDALARLNPDLPAQALLDAFRKRTRPDGADLVQRNRVAPNALLAVSDGVEERVGSLGAGREWSNPWRTIAGDALAGAHVRGLQEA